MRFEPLRRLEVGRKSPSVVFGPLSLNPKKLLIAKTSDADPFWLASGKGENHPTPSLPRNHERLLWRKGAARLNGHDGHTAAVSSSAIVSRERTLAPGLLTDNLLWRQPMDRRCLRREHRAGFAAFRHHPRL